MLKEILFSSFGNNDIELQKDTIKYKITLKILFSSLIFLILINKTLFASPISIEPRKELQIGIIPFYPFCYMEDNKAKGEYAEIVRRILTKLEVPFAPFHEYPPKRLYILLGNGTLDAFMGVRGIPEYDQQVLYSSKPQVKIRLHMYTTDENVDIPTTKETMTGKSIIVIRGYNYSGLLELLENPASQINLLYANSHVSGLKMLSSNRASFFLDYNAPVKKALKEYDVPSLRYKVLQETPLWLMVSKNLPNAEALIKAMEETFHELKESGAFSDLSPDIYAE